MLNHPRLIRVVSQSRQLALSFYLSYTHGNAHGSHQKNLVQRTNNLLLFNYPGASHGGAAHPKVNCAPSMPCGAAILQIAGVIAALFRSTISCLHWCLPIVHSRCQYIALPILEWVASVTKERGTVLLQGQGHEGLGPQRGRRKHGSLCSIAREDKRRTRRVYSNPRQQALVIS